MKQISGYVLKMSKLIALITILPAASQAIFVPGFPGECGYGSTRVPMDGHIIRLGYVASTPYGWSFVFPDNEATVSMERVDIADNVGLLGQDPAANLSGSVRAATPEGAYVVAQIFVGDPNIEPIVTCMSGLLPLTSYNPALYGADFLWLQKPAFGRWLKVRTYSKSWNWRSWWGNKFGDIRRQFKGFKKGDGKWPSITKPDDERRRQKWKRPSKDSNRPTILPVKKLRDGRNNP